MIAQAWLALALAGGIAAGLAGVYFEGKRAGKAQCSSTQQLAREVAREAADAAASAAAGQIARISVKHTTIRQELEREVLTREVFRDCRSGADAVRLLNASPGVAASGPVAAGGRELPASGAAD